MAGSSPNIGTVIGGRYRLEAQLGEGAFGTVWRASTVENAWGDRFALKLLHANLLSASWVRERFVREAEICRQLRHENIARAVAWSADPPQPYLALEYVDGTTLSEVLQKNALLERHFSIAELEALARQLFAAVTYAHERKIVHRDLKPKNLMIVRGEGEPILKVLDFGISKMLSAAGDGTTVGRLLGTPAYMAPEQIRSATVDERTDVFALGTILFEMITLQRAWVEKSGAASHVEIFARVIEGPRPRPSAHRAELSGELDRVIARATAVDPGERFQTAVELAQAFSAALHAKPGEGSFEEESTAGEELPKTAVQPQDLEVITAKPNDLEVITVEPQVTERESPAIRPQYVKTWPGQLAPSDTEPGPTLPPKVTATLQLAPAARARSTRDFVLWAIGLAVPLTAAATITILWIDHDAQPIVAKVVPTREAPANVEPPRAEAKPRIEPETPQPVEDGPPLAVEPPKPAVPPRERPARARDPAPEPRELLPKTAGDPLVRRIDELVAKLKADPGQTALIGELAEAIIRAARGLEDSTARTALERRATASAAVGDIAGLEACARELAKAKREQAPEP